MIESSSGRRAGVTLLELLLTLAIMGVILAVTTLAFRIVQQPAADDPFYIVADSLRAAIAASQRATFHVVVGGVLASVTTLPDGSVIGDSALAIDRLSGKRRHDR